MGELTQCLTSSQFPQTFLTSPSKLRIDLCKIPTVISETLIVLGYMLLWCFKKPTFILYIYLFSGDSIPDRTRNILPGQCYDYVQPQVGFDGAGFAKLGRPKWGFLLKCSWIVFYFSWSLNFLAKWSTSSSLPVNQTLEFLRGFYAG